MVFGGLFHMEAELKEWNIGLRIKMTEHRPCSVIESPHLGIRLDLGIANLGPDLLGELRASGRGILNVKESLGKTVEVMDRLGPLHARDPASLGHPMSRHTENCPRPRDF